MPTSNILIVEDESIIAKDLQKILETAQYPKPSIARNAKDAMQRMKESTPDLVIMDIVLESGMDGIELTKHINETSNVPVMYLTAYMNDGMITRAEETVHFGYIVKPFKEPVLLQTIEDVFKNASSKNIAAHSRANTAIPQTNPSHLRLRTNDQCLQYLFELRFPNVRCLQCKRTNAYHRHPQKLCYSCTCGKSHIYPKRGTIFEESRLPLTKWFHAISLMCQFHNDISVKELEKNLSVTYATARKLKKVIQSLLPLEQWQSDALSFESVLPRTVTAKSAVR